MADPDAGSGWEAGLDRVRSSAGTRGLLLLAASLCRRLWERFPHDDCRQAVEAVERLAHHPGVEGNDYTVAVAVAAEADADAAMERLRQGYFRVAEAAPGPRGAYIAATACCGMWNDPTGLIGDVAAAAALAVAGGTEGPAWEAERRAQIVLFNAFTGPPSEPETDKV